MTRTAPGLMLALCSPCLYADDGLSDRDIEQINQAVAVVTSGQVIQYNEFVSGCPWLAEAACSRQVPVLISFHGRQKTMIVSKIDGQWQVRQLSSPPGQRPAK